MSSHAAFATIADLIALKRETTALAASKRECRRDMASRFETVHKAIADHVESNDRMLREISNRLAVLTKMVAELKADK